MRRHGAVAAALAVLLLSAAAAQADEVTSEINKALAAYDKKDLKGAASALDTAATLIRQQETAEWKALLPGPLPGWNAEAPEGSAISPALFGGALTVSRRYVKGKNTVTVSFVANAPMVQALTQFLTGGFGVMLGAGKLEIIAGRRFLYSKNDNSYESVVAKTVLVKVEGNPTTHKAALRRYIDAIEFAAVKRLGS